MGSSAVTRIVVALCLCLAGAAVSGVLLGQHHGETWAVSTVNEACGDGQTSGCEDVARSSWSSFAGLPVAAYGLAFYLSLSLLLALALLAPARPARRVRGRRGRRPRPRPARGPPAPRRAGLRDPRVLQALHPDLRPERGRALRPASRPARRPRHGRRGRPPGGPPRARGLGAREPRGGGSRPRLHATLAARARTGRRRCSARRPVAARDPSRPRRAAPVPPPRSGAPAAAAPPRPPRKPRRGRRTRSTGRSGRRSSRRPSTTRASSTPTSRRRPSSEYDTAAGVDRPRERPGEGPATAPVTVVEYSDFICPFCRSSPDALSQFVPQAGGRVVVYFKNYPARQGLQPELPALDPPRRLQPGPGRLCAHYQGKFEAYHDRSSRPSCTTRRPPTSCASPARPGSTRRRPGLPRRPEDEGRSRRPDRGRRPARRDSTPTVYVNGKKLPRINDFVAVVDKEARKKGFKPLAQ